MTIYRFFLHKDKDVKEIHNYWRQPWDGANLPEEYLIGCESRSKFLVRLMKKYANLDMKILEIGCNVGRNLNYLFCEGFTNLSGIEISENAIKLLKEAYPEMSNSTKIYNKPVENIIREFKDNEYDIVFTMAVLEHIHKKSEWIFEEIVRITKRFLITIEDEKFLGWKHFPRNYGKIFERIGMRQVEKIRLSHIEGLGWEFFARVFKK